VVSFAVLVATASVADNRLPWGHFDNLQLKRLGVPNSWRAYSEGIGVGSNFSGSRNVALVVGSFNGNGSRLSRGRKFELRHYPIFGTSQPEPFPKNPLSTAENVSLIQ